jgi:hypothetical protein
MMWIWHRMSKNEWYRQNNQTQGKNHVEKISFLLATIFISSATMTFTFAQEKIPIDTHQEFISFLENILEHEAVNPENTTMFFQRSWAYWAEHKLDYNLDPEKYAKALSLLHQNQQKFKRNNTIKIDRFENTIEGFRRFDKRNTRAKDPVLFVGSSSIVFWETSLSFPDLPIINRGFGGASLPEIIHYYDDVIKKIFAIPDGCLL